MTRFSKSQIALHWLTLLLIVLAYLSIEFRGVFVKNSPAYLLMREIHYNCGVLVWALMLVRVVLRHLLPDPAIIPTPPRWQHLAAKLMYLALYLWFIALPVLGVLLMAYGDKSWSFLGFPITPWVTPDPATKSLLKEWHETLANIGYALIALHATAALYHHYIIKDNALLLMMPKKKS
ncbi:cytochrome b [Plesiomonas shigelloides]|uniref:cytochrome b n=1 Tax=Plesiomonas shigelloides TaxID=703 RepID=UPI001C041AB6|nr:cytochrome b [Plesiomonas shigelloides]QWK93628.1 cytochrome b [Plesiomonas shigelloides]